jgi:hypothetical protein
MAQFSHLYMATYEDLSSFYYHSFEVRGFIICKGLPIWHNFHIYTWLRMRTLCVHYLYGS